MHVAIMCEDKMPAHSNDRVRNNNYATYVKKDLRRC